MNDLQVFRNTVFGELNILVEDGKVLFPATESAKMIGYANPRKAILDHCKGVTKRDIPTDGGLQEMNFIPEGDLYRLICPSRKGSEPDEILCKFYREVYLMKYGLFRLFPGLWKKAVWKARRGDTQPAIDLGIRNKTSKGQIRQ